MKKKKKFSPINSKILVVSLNIYRNNNNNNNESPLTQQPALDLQTTQTQFPLSNWNQSPQRATNPSSRSTGQKTHEWKMAASATHGRRTPPPRGAPSCETYL